MYKNLNKEIIIISWNVHYPYFAVNNDYVITTLEDLNRPDVICLQEYVEGAGGKLLNWLEDNGYEYEYLPFANFEGKSMGVLTAVKRNFKTNFQSVTLRTDEPRRFRPFKNIRGLISTNIFVGNRSFDIINTHLTYPRFHTIDMRKREFMNFKTYLDKYQSKALFICGDFNFLPLDGRRRFLKKRFASYSGNFKNKTWKHSMKLSPLTGNPDYLFWEKSLLKIDASLVDYNTSDHRPLLAKISFKN